MHPDTALHDTLERRAFAAWSITIPASFAETFVAGEGYWHAWDEDRSVSLSSFTITDEVGPVDAEAIARELPRSEGTPVDGLPPGLSGWAVQTKAPQPARASRALSGMLVADGRVLLVTITGDDLTWVRTTWSSIRFHPAGRQGHR